LWLSSIPEGTFPWAISIKGNILCGGNKEFMLIDKKEDLTE